MKFLHLALAAAVAGEAFANWFHSKPAYNNWHETELERWLADHGVEYTTPADRKELERIVQENWQAKAHSPYQEWDTHRLQTYLGEKGHEIDHKRKEDKNWLIESVKKLWYETENAADEAWSKVNYWIFDTWTDAQLKAFLDRHGIKAPHPKERESLLETAKDNYNNIAKKLGETASYPGNWLYESWTDKDLKKWLEHNGYPVPKHATRDKLVAEVRRNSRLASLKLRESADAASKKAAEATQSVSDTVFDAWSDSQLKEFLDKHGVKVPQGSKRNELIALARRNKAYYTPSNVSKSASSAYSSASSVVGDKAAYVTDKAAQATDAAAAKGQEAFNALIEQWSDSRLKAFLDARGVTVPQTSRRDELLASVRKNRHKAATTFGAWTFESWSIEALRQWLEERGQKVSDSAKTSRDDLYNSAVAYYNSVASAASATGSQATDTAASAKDKAASAKDKAASSASSASSGVASSASSAASHASSAASSAASGATSVVKDAGASASSVASHATDAAAASASQAYASVTSAIAAATQSAKDTTFDTWSDSDLKAYLDTYGIQTYQGSTRNELIAAVRRNSHAFRYGSEDQGVYGHLKSSVKSAGEKIGQWIGYGKKQVEKAGDRVYENSQAAYDRAQESVQSVTHRAQESATHMSNKAKESATHYSDRYKEEL